MALFVCIAVVAIATNAKYIVSYVPEHFPN